MVRLNQNVIYRLFWKLKSNGAPYQRERFLARLRPGAGYTILLKIAFLSLNSYINQ